MTALLYASCAVWFGTEMWIGLTRGVRPSGKLADRGSRFVVVIGVGFGLWLAFNAARFFPSAAIAQNRLLFFYIGIACIAAGVALRLFAVKTLGRFFTTTVATQGDQTVVENGPYKWVRHPSYSGALLSMFGLCLALTNWMAFVALIPALAGLGYRIAVEEQALVAGLGEPYRLYMRRTKRLIPFVL